MSLRLPHCNRELVSLSVLQSSALLSLSVHNSKISQYIYSQYIYSRSSTEAPKICGRFKVFRTETSIMHNPSPSPRTRPLHSKQRQLSYRNGRDELVPTEHCLPNGWELRAYKCSESQTSFCCIIAPFFCSSSCEITGFGVHVCSVITVVAVTVR